MTSGNQHFRAFISYSHRDKRWAAWLHRALETYRVPKHLIGQETAFGPVTARIGKVFRDRDDLPVSADLSGEINEALKATQFLVVLCSPSSAKSQWVNQEIINFKRLKGEASIICIIVDGEPFGSLKPSQGDQECFAPALRFQVKADGTLSDHPAEPIAADLRPHADGKRLAKLKIIAGLLGVKLDDLVQRENQRRQHRLTCLAAASVVGMMVMSALTYQAITAQNLAEDRRVSAEGLVEFMIEDLRHPLEEVGRLDAFEKVIDKTVAYYESQNLDSAPDDTLGRWARALHFAANTRFQLGDNVAARKDAAEAHTITAELVARAPDSHERKSEHAQSKFWLGQIEYAQGDYQNAAISMWSYLNITKELADLEPKNMTYLTNASRSAYSYGAVLTKLGQTEDAIDQFRLAQSYFQNLDALVPGNEDVALDRAYTNRWLADAYEAIGQTRDALALRRKNVDEFRQFHEAYPADKHFEFDLVKALRLLYETEISIESSIAAFSYIEEAQTRIKSLIAFDKTNQSWSEEALNLSKHTLAKSNSVNISAEMTGNE